MTTRNTSEVQKAFLPKTHPCEGKEYMKGHQHSLFKSTQRTGTTLYTQQFLSPNDIKCIIVLSHGYAEHSSRYCEFASQLANRLSATVCLIDHFGHGCSDGLPGFVDSIFTVSKDLVEYTQWAKKQFGKEDTKVFLIGNSMGGLIGFQTIKQNPDLFHAFVSLGPLVLPTNPPNGFVIMMATVMNWLVPTMALVDPHLDNINTDKKIHEQFLVDPYNYVGKMRVGTGLAMQDGFFDLQANLDKITAPLLLIHGDKDTACDVKGSILVHEKASSKVKDLKIYKDQNHELLWEPKGEEILKDILDWLETKL